MHAYGALSLTDCLQHLHLDAIHTHSIEYTGHTQTHTLVLYLLKSPVINQSWTMDHMAVGWIWTWTWDQGHARVGICITLLTSITPSTDTPLVINPTVSMLWNWYTVDACFLSSSWHVTSKAQFAGSVIGICLLVMAIEGVRRLGREYDRRLLRARNDAVENATCGMGNVGSAGLVKVLTATNNASKVLPSPTTTAATATTGGCGSKSTTGGGCASKNKAPSIHEPEIMPVAAKVSSCCGGGGGGNASPSSAAETPSKEYKEFNHTPTAELGGFAALNSAGGFAQMHCRPPVPRLPTWTQQMVRSFIYGSQFSAAFLV